MIVENPYTQPHYLTMFFPIKPKVIDNDRTVNGDYYRKPTQYWFVNCEPENNVCFEAMEYVEKYTIMDENSQTRKTKRSLIHRQYAKRFLKNYVLDVEGGIWGACV